MILGCLTFSGNGNDFSLVEHIFRVTDSEGLRFHPVVQEGFTGGYFLHSALPGKPADFYYSDETNDIIVLLSGYIYNRQELGHLLNINTPIPDPEMIANLYLKIGPGFADSLNGDYAIFILRSKKKQAYLFRDHLGIRPLAWVTDRQALFFSSDIIGLCRAFSEGKVIESDYLMGYFKYIDYRKTPCEHVTKLLPGHYLFFSEDGGKVSKYWAPETIRTDKTLTHDQMLAEFRAIVLNAVQIRCDHRFTAGAHVSSGIDSGIVSALARKEYSQQDSFYGFSWSPDGYEAKNVKYDERELVIKFAEKAGIRVLFSEMSVTDFPRFISGFYGNQGYFSEDSVVEQAAAVKTNLIFSGWGGDEFISTGERGISLDLLQGLHLRTFFRRNRIMNLKNFVKNQLFYVIYPALGILDRNIAKSFRDDAKYIKRPFRQSDREAIRNFYFHTSRHQLHLRLLQFYHLQERCESWMINGYRKGVEYRYPLLDRRIIEYMLKVPSELLCKTDYFRPVLREISDGILSEELRWNYSKNDPVWWAYMEELLRDSGTLFMDEIDDWKENSELHFVDFDLLSEDISKYRDKPDSVDQNVLFRALVYIKAIHEFTIDYRIKA